MRIRSNELLPLVILGVTWAAPASAIPIIFDITGTVRQRSTFDLTTNSYTVDDAAFGQAVAAQILIDTDAFAAPVRRDSVESDVITFQGLEEGSRGISVSLTMGGVMVDTAPFSGSRGEVSFGDSHGWIPASDGSASMSPDQWAIRTHSEEVGPGGISAMRSFSFVAGETVDPIVPGSGMTWLDFSQPVNLDLLLTLPTESISFPPSLFLSDSNFDCTDGCRQIGITNSFMTITSLTRSISSVPEPGTLGLLVAGFAGVLLARRRRRALI